MSYFKDGRAAYLAQMEEYRKQGCVERVAQVGGTSLLVGAFAGAVTASWRESLVIGAPRTTYFRAVMDVGRGLGQSAAVFGIVGAAFAIGDCGAQTFRGKNDWVNQSMGGVFAGLALGAVTRSIPGAVGSAAALGGVCAMLGMAPLVENHPLMKE